MFFLEIIPASLSCKLKCCSVANTQLAFVDNYRTFLDSSGVYISIDYRCWLGLCFNPHLIPNGMRPEIVECRAEKPDIYYILVHRTISGITRGYTRSRIKPSSWIYARHLFFGKLQILLKVIIPLIRDRLDTIRRNAIRCYWASGVATGRQEHDQEQWSHVSTKEQVMDALSSCSHIAPPIHSPPTEFSLDSTSRKYDSY